MLKIERDKVYIDGRGQRFRVVCVDKMTGDANYPIIAVNDDGSIYTFTSEGRSGCPGYEERREYDLAYEVKEKQVRYINIYPDGQNGTGFIYKSKLDAEKGAGTSRLACVRVEYEEGQFDD